MQAGRRDACKEGQNYCPFASEDAIALRRVRSCGITRVAFQQSRNACSMRRAPDPPSLECLEPVIWVALERQIVNRVSLPMQVRAASPDVQNARLDAQTGQGGPMTDELLSINRVARVLDCSPKTIRDWMYKARRAPTTDPLPYYRLNGLIRFRLAEVCAWIDRRRVRWTAVDVASDPAGEMRHRSRNL